LKKEFRLAIAASLALHVMALLPLLFASPKPPLPAPEPVVSVTLLSPAPEKEALQTSHAPPPDKNDDPAPTPTAPSPVRPSAPQPPPARLATPPQPQQQQQPDSPAGQVVATSFYAAKILARPENRAARADLKTLSPAEQHEQLCDTEGMEQLHRWKPALQPDRLIAYALGDTVVEGSTLHAPNAAFRSRHRWYELSFDCAIDAAGSEVTAFRFTMGNPIPEDRLSELFLER
jgi:hypothetical protein